MTEINYDHYELIYKDEPMTALEFLKKSSEGKHRIVSSGDLLPMQVGEAQGNGLLYIDEATGLGWALVPWTLSTPKDRSREEEWFHKQYGSNA